MDTKTFVEAVACVVRLFELGIISFLEMSNLIETIKTKLNGSEEKH